MARRVAIAPGVVVELLKGVDQPKPGGPLRVRLQFPRLGMHYEYFDPTAKGARAANQRIGRLRDLRDAGELPDANPDAVTLGDAARDLLELKRSHDSDKTGRPLTAGGIAFQQRVLKPWMDGPWADTPTDMLPVTQIRLRQRQRGAEHPKSARDELAALKAVLRHARSEMKADIQEELLILKPPAKRRLKIRRPLRIDQLDLLAASAPPAYQRLILLHGSVGNRISELLLARPRDVKFDRRVLLVRDPKEASTMLEPKAIPLLDEELDLFAEQLGVDRAGRRLRAVTASVTAHLPTTPPGSTLIWPMPNGQPWPVTDGRVASAYFARAIWTPAVRAATKAWLEQHPDDDDCPFDGITSHDLRVTSVTTMRDRGMSADTCSYRVGHHDGGALVRRVYDQGDKEARALAELQQLGYGLLDAARRAAAGAATTPSEEAAR